MFFPWPLLSAALFYVVLGLPASLCPAFRIKPGQEQDKPDARGHDDDGDGRNPKETHLSFASHLALSSAFRFSIRASASLAAAHNPRTKVMAIPMTIPSISMLFSFLRPATDDLRAALRAELHLCRVFPLPDTLACVTKPFAEPGLILVGHLFQAAHFNFQFLPPPFGFLGFHPRGTLPVPQRSLLHLPFRIMLSQMSQY